MDFINSLHASAYEDLDFINTFEGDLTGWKSCKFDEIFKAQLMDVYNRVQRPVAIIEVGTWKGCSAIGMAKVAKECNVEVKIICVDTWLGSPEFYTTTGIKEEACGLSLKRKNGYVCPLIYQCNFVF